jgi:hypothetical protein
VNLSLFNEEKGKNDEKNDWRRVEDSSPLFLTDADPGENKIYSAC